MTNTPIISICLGLAALALLALGAWFIVRRIRRDRHAERLRGETGPERPISAEMEYDRLRNENNRLNYDMIVLYQFVNDLGACRSTEAVCRKFIQTIQQSIAPDVSGLLLLEPDGRRLTLAAHHGLDGMAENRFCFETERGFVGWIVANGRELHVDAEGASRFPELGEAPFHPYFHAALGLPLLVQHRVLGATILGRVAGRFTQDELRLLFIIANEAALYLQNLRLYEQVANLAIQDGSTGLYNHRYFFEQLEIQLARARETKTPLSLLMIDIDRFKPFNDRYGHLTGDKILREVAGIIRETVDEQHLAARYGGEEFAVIMAGTGAEQAFRIAEEIRRRIKEYRFPMSDGRHAQVTVSIGLATWPVHVDGDSHSVNDLIAAADDQLVLFAKNGGRDRVCRPPDRRLDLS